MDTEVLSMDGNPDQGYMRIVRHLDSDIVTKDLTGAHRVPYMDFNPTDPTGQIYHAVMEGSAALEDPGVPGFDVQGDLEAPPSFDSIQDLSRVLSGEQEGGRSVIDWDQLSLNHQRVLTSALEEAPLSFLALSWCSLAARRFNGGKNNRGRPYAECLIPAGLELVRLGLVGVRVSDPNDRVLSMEHALQVIGDIDNWWRFNNGATVEDPVASGPREGALTKDGPWISEYSLFQAARDRYTISRWSWPARISDLAPPQQ